MASDQANLKLCRSSESTDTALFPRHLTELRESGLSDQTIRMAGIYSGTYSEATRILGFNPRADGLFFPYPGTDFVRFKPDIPFLGKDGRPAKYLTKTNGGNRLYIPPFYADALLEDSQISLIITEGEKKSLKGAQDLRGFVVIGLAGVWCFKTKEKGLLEDFCKFSWKDRDVYVCYDSDVVKKPEVKIAENKLAGRLDLLGANVYICRFPT
ncbi:MAG TPA: DUF3854 domain-containing protein [Syntrophobacteraceae bacterium]|nr:DUF3854 domain-containing protein [Syntrophobacteraceae bacterium]